ncbi:pyridoxal phosphate-dependent transferase [Massariosphaeria phaeospora]|uniref:Pyridoxal phosphate-dependent transferase n=1 Tax=Massariosphaeria phaeospora TaxID=100035 RepID=A0A7C8M0P6_9PLEO|nr:pyridoxal phosphate-dependent transferase [Massariosphaeria phaeospora]
MARTTDGNPERLAYNDRVDRLRRKEYRMLKGTTYLDHAGTTLPATSLVTQFSHSLQTLLLANPHSASASAPNTSHRIVEETRLKVLKLFNASPEHFDIVFVANATAGIKLVLEAFSGHDEGFDYYYHRNAHTSLVGVREHAASSHCFASDAEVEQWLQDEHSFSGDANTDRPTLFAYPAQSNMNGRRLPLSWPAALRSTSQRLRTYSLLDVAALVSTSPLDLSDHAAAPDFTVMSFYKMFGFPNLGALIVRKSAAHVFDQRRYFGGGTTEMITCIGTQWVAKKEKRLTDRLEDGTGATHSILALHCAIDVHDMLYGGFSEISKHTGWLAKTLYERLASLKHANGRPVCQIYKDPAATYGDALTQGATVTFNISSSDGAWISSWKVGQLASSKNIHIRTGSLCNPAGMACALGLSSSDVQRAYASGFRCGQEADIREGIPFGMVRASFGAMSTLEDVSIFAKFVQDHFVGKGLLNVDDNDEKRVKSEEMRRSEQSSTPSFEKPGLRLRPVRQQFWAKFGACIPFRSRRPDVVSAH